MNFYSLIQSVDQTVYIQCETQLPVKAHHVRQERPDVYSSSYDGTATGTHQHKPEFVFIARHFL